MFRYVYTRKAFISLSSYLSKREVFGPCFRPGDLTDLDVPLPAIGLLRPPKKDPEIMHGNICDIGPANTNKKKVRIHISSLGLDVPDIHVSV